VSAEPYTPAPVNAKVATAADVDAVADTLARAFYEDPVWAWAFPDPERRLEQHRAAWRLLVESGLENEWIWLTDGCASASLWVPPGKPELRPEDEEPFEALIQDLLGDGAARVMETFERFENAHPSHRPHYYLSLLGTHPDHSGQGLGMGLLADNLKHTDAAGIATYLESTNPANRPRYERLGFVPWGEFELPEDGPSVMQMWRDPS
jgi:Acetyltransferase (GNAT) family.